MNWDYVSVTDCYWAVPVTLPETVSGTLPFLCCKELFIFWPQTEHAPSLSLKCKNAHLVV